MTNKKNKTLGILLFIDILAILSMYAFGAYKDMSQSCIGFATASSPCAEEYFYGPLALAYSVGFLLFSLIVLNWTTDNFKKTKKK